MAKRLIKKITWVDLNTSKKDTAKSYNMKETFLLGDAIDHSTFGVGFIQTIESNKIQVLFEDKTRTLMHATSI